MCKRNFDRIRCSEWNFKECPDNELQFCLRYELSREIEDWQNMIRQRREAGGHCPDLAPMFSVFSEGHSAIMPPFEFDVTYPHLADLICWDEWPASPWLELPSEKRSAFVKRPSIAEAWALHTDAWPLMKGSNPDCFVTVEEKNRLISYAALKIDWSKPNSQLLREFEAWLRQRREQVGGIAVETRGGIRYRDILRKLGALRLLRAMSWEEASDLTQKVLGSPLYSEHSAWSRAKSQAARVMVQYKEHRNLEAVLGKPLTNKKNV